LRPALAGSELNPKVNNVDFPNWYWINAGNIFIVSKNVGVSYHP
jgi:hypothetical protein